MMKTFPLVTVITVTFNCIASKRERFLIENINSVANQTYPNLEHLFIDGASTDGTVEFLTSFVQSGFIRLITERDNGIYDAMNKGHKLANGDYVLVLNSDDSYAYPGAIYDLMSSLMNNNAEYAYGDQICIRPDNSTFVDRFDLSAFWQRMPFNHPTLLIKKSIVQELGFYRTDLDTVADYKFVIDLILKDYKGVGVRKNIVNFRLGGTSFDEKTLYSKYWASYIKLPKVLSLLYLQFDPRMVEENIINGFMLETDGVYDDVFLDRLLIFMLNRKLKNYDYDSFVSFVLKLKRRKAISGNVIAQDVRYKFLGLTIFQKKLRKYGTRVKLFGFIPIACFFSKPF